MLYFIFIPITLALLAAFMLLTLAEARTGARLFGSARERFDARVARAGFVLRHVDWGAFLNDVARASFERALHDIAHGTLIAVRFIERILTRVVRYLRMRRERLIPQASLEPKASRLTQTATYLRQTLSRTRRVPKNLPGQPPEDVVEL
ncbi:MAG TPA: hypothetical protein VGN56_02445 [Candidatus Paceibacterota bacterium]|jgi:hypothetical protein|nr:hypothetical protein [Candidatus Paceibacterota bacterium]